MTCLFRVTSHSGMEGLGIVIDGFLIFAFPDWEINEPLTYCSVDGQRCVEVHPSEISITNYKCIYVTPFQGAGIDLWRSLEPLAPGSKVYQVWLEGSRLRIAEKTIKEFNRIFNVGLFHVTKESSGKFPAFSFDESGNFRGMTFTENRLLSERSLEAIRRSFGQKKKGYIFDLEVMSNTMENSAQVLNSDKSSLKTGDKILKVDGLKVASAEEVAEVIANLYKNIIELEVKRGDDNVFVYLKALS